jgi:hypothetical protein
MKNSPLHKILVPGLLTMAFAFAFATNARSAQDDSAPQEKAPSKAELKKYDANGDGKLDDAEKAQMKADAKTKRDAQRAADLAKYDTNKDGKLSKEEKEAMKADKDAAKEAEKAAKQAAKNSTDAADK